MPKLDLKYLNDELKEGLRASHLYAVFGYTPYPEFDEHSSVWTFATKHEGSCDEAHTEDDRNAVCI